MYGNDNHKIVYGINSQPDDGNDDIVTYIILIYL